MPKVSIVIPAYNCAATLERAVRSALNQTLSDVEVIVVDDGSRDPTPALARKLAAREPRVRLLQRDNGGPAAARNTGIRDARADWIVILDSDDTLPPDSIERQLGACEREGTLWAVIDIIRRKGGVDELLPGRLPRKGALEHALVHRFPFRAVFYHRLAFERAGLHDESFRSCVDWEMHGRLLSAGVPFSYVDNPCYIYWIQDESVTKGKNFARHLRNIERIYDTYYKPQLSRSPAVRKAYAHYMLSLARHYRWNKVGWGAVARATAKALAARPAVVTELWP